MKSPTRLRLTLALLSLVLLTSSARANLGSYVFSSGSGSAYDMSGATQIFEGSQECSGTNIDDNAANAVSIGFTFRFDDIDYTKFSASTNGVIGLFRSWGSTNVTKCWVNLLNSTSGGCSGDYGMTLDSIPQIMPYWDDLRVPGQCNDDGFNGSISYKLFGSAPNRVLVIEYTDIEFDYYRYNYATMQTRLYEGSNAIEFWYTGFDGSYNGDGGSIGLAATGGTSYVSVTPGTTATASSSVVNNAVDPLDIPDNALYTFTPCGPRLLGNLAQGGSASMTTGDSLFAGTSVQVGSTASLTPFTITVPGGGCPSLSYTLSLTGPYASDYQISPTSGSIEAGGSMSPTFTITPDCSGPRPATLTLAMSDGTQRTYLLAASAAPQSGFTGNVSQGGTATVASGDTLLGDIVVERGTPIALGPLTITNLNTDPASVPLDVAFMLDDPTGQYTISTTGTTLAAGASITPTITFTGVGVAAQEARLVVTAGCDTREYLLRAFSAAPGGVLIADGFELDSTQSIYNGLLSCVGSQVNAIPIEVRNTGNGPFVITGITIYRTDTLYQQGTGPYPLLRDAMGQPIPTSDYMVMLTPGTAPLTPEQALALPFSVPEGQSRTIYIVFVGREAGRRYARVYVQTNGLNQAATNAAGVLVPGLARFDLVARAIGAQLAATPTGDRLRPVILPSVAVDDTSTATFTVSNAGACDLLIRRDKLRITSGDVHEFALTSVLPATPVDAATNTYRLVPGATDVITVRFTPSRSGTRMATLMLQTNDSAIQLPGLSERGTYRLDLYGFGRAGLDAANLALPPVLIGGVVGGVAVLENSSTAAVEIRQISIVGEHASEFRASTPPWPALPVRVLPGAKLRLGVELAPTGEAGARRAILELITTTEDTIRVAITGEAGIAQLEVAPTTLFDNVEIQVGQYVRRNVTITNLGTFPVRIELPVITGPDAGNYTLGALPRLDLSPGQTEYLEVTFSPQTQGASEATLEIQSSLGVRTVQLGGTSLMANGGDDDESGRIGTGGARDGVSGIVTGEALALRVEAIRPNPTSAGAEIGFAIARAGTVAVTLHDATGRLVETLAAERYEAGRHAIRFATEALPSGVYHVRVAIDGATTSTTLTVAR